MLVSVQYIVVAMSNSNQTLYKKITSALKEKFPDKLDKIILLAGFDSEQSFLNLNSESIPEIEQYINDNKHILTGTSYENTIQTHFKLKPGHKIFLLGIPKALESFNKKKKEQKKQKEQKKLEKRTSQIRNENDDQFVNSEDIENGTIEVSSIECELKQKLIEKITKFASKHSVTLIIDTNNIVELEENNTKYKCQIICPICQKQLKCEHTTYWLISNFEKHLKRHFLNEFHEQSAYVENPIYTGNDLDEELNSP